MADTLQIAQASKKAIGVLGGTFNPVHLGHIHYANSLVKDFELSKLLLVPCALPAHRGEPSVSAKDRLAMLSLAIENEDKLELSSIELERLQHDSQRHPRRPSYTVDTLQALRKQYPKQPLYFAMGSDAFEHFETWHQWQTILELCNLIVVDRPGSQLQAMLQAKQAVWLHEYHQGFTGHKCCAGEVYICQSSMLPVSATRVRETISQHDTQRAAEFLDEQVLAYITQQHLYID